MEESINKVMELQELVKRFMNFLLDINRVINYTVKRSKRVYSGFKRKNGFVDPKIKRVSLLTSEDVLHTS